MVGACNQHLFIILQLFYAYVQAFRAFFLQTCYFHCNMCLPVKKLVSSLPPQPLVTIDQTWGNGWTACGVARSVEWPDRTRCPILPWLSYLNNKLDSVSSFLRQSWLCDCVFVPLVISWQLGFIQIETAQQDCGEENPGEGGREHMYVCVIGMTSRSLSRPPLHPFACF